MFLVFKRISTGTSPVAEILTSTPFSGTTVCTWRIYGFAPGWHGNIMGVHMNGYRVGGCIMVIRFGMWLGLALCCASANAGDVGNRLTYLDSPIDPYYVDRDTARLVTPQWVGDEGVEAVIVLAIDDMADADKYEQFLRPILDRLKQIDGRAPVSIMTKQIDPTLPRLQSWAEEGVSVEAHTQDHPCPCLQAGSFDKAKSTFDRCVDQLSPLPGGGPVAFRMPCCDSMNSVSPRFFAEIFNKTTPEGRFSDDRHVRVYVVYGQRPGPASRSGAGRRRAREVSQVHSDRSYHGKLHRGLSLPLRDRPTVLGVPQPDAQRLGRAASARYVQPRDACATSKRRSTPRSSSRACSRCVFIRTTGSATIRSSS